MKLAIHRLLRRLGLNVQRHRDCFEELARFAGPDVKTVIDGGAYDGGTAEIFLRLFPQAQVIAFEPQPECVAKIVARIGDNPRFVLHPMALSDHEGVDTLHVPVSEIYSASMLKPNESFGRTKTMQVSMTTLDAIGPADVIKLDLQGHELTVLEGARTILPGVRAILCEVNFQPLYEGCCLFHEVAEFLHDYGLNLHRCYDIQTDKNGRWKMADALFVRY